MKESLFAPAFIASSVLHILFLTLGSAPSIPPPPPRMQLQITMPEPATVEPEAPAPMEPEGMAAEADADLIDPDPARLATELEPELETAKPDETAAVEEPPGIGMEEPAQIRAATAVQPLQAAPSLEADPDETSPSEKEPEDADGPGEAAKDAAAAERLLDDLTASESQRKDLERYRFQVREQVREILQNEHKHLQKVVENAPSRHFRVRFRIDVDGHIFDLGLITPPGTRGKYTRVIDRLHALSPLAKPPASASAPLSFEFYVEVR